jgi:hypothetical protein
MSQSYRIETLGHFSTYGDGPKGDYLCTVAGDDRELKLFHDTSGNYDPPKVGDEIFGDIVPGKRNGEWRLKRGSRQGGGSSSSAGGGGRSSDPPDRFDRKPEHPRNEVRMIHTSALSAAPAYYELLRTEGVIPQAESKAAALATLAGIVTWLENGYGPVLDAVVAEVKAAPQMNGGGGEVPADTTGLQPAAASKADDDIPFRRLPIPDLEARRRDLFTGDRIV